MRSLLAWTRKAIFEIEEVDYERWCHHIGTERKLLRSTQRTYQKGVRVVIKFLHKSQDIQNEAMAKFGKRLELFATTDNSIVHSSQNESLGRHPPMRHEEVTQLFDSLATRIEQAAIEAPRCVRALCRDRAMFYVFYLYALRASEVGALEFKDWRRDPSIPECGEYAYLVVRNGKGAKGSGKRGRVVPSTDVTIVDVMDWYRNEVRPLYQPKPGFENCVFLSEQGTPISVNSLQSRLEQHLAAANITTHYTSHSLRRSGGQHSSMRAGSSFAKELLGHVDEKTTVLYTQTPADHARRRANKLVRRQLDDINGRDRE
jgi:integrase